MIDEKEAEAVAKRFLLLVESKPELERCKNVFMGTLFQTQVLGEEVEKLSRENYELRMLLWFTHICYGNDQWSGVTHSGIYMKCSAEQHKIDFARDDIEALRKALLDHATNEHNIRWAQKMANIKITVTASGENATHTAEERS